MFTWTVLTGLGYGFFVAVRVVDEHASLLTPAAVVVAAVIATLPLAVGLGMARGRWFAMSGLESMLARLGEQPSLAGLQRTMSRAFADPSLQLLSWRRSLQRYVDADGAPVENGAIDPRRTVTEFGRGGEKVAAIVHDPVLAADPDVLAAAGRALRLALDNDRLHTDLTTSIEELEASRKRVASAADEERRRIERDLHDGAQQDLIALRIKLGLLEELASENGTPVAREIAEAGERVDTAIGRIRDLARGIYPGVLRDFGLSYALAPVAQELPLQIDTHADTRKRFAPEVETAVYFCCVEALQNAAKHCGPATRVALRISDRSSGLVFAIEDDGPGFDPALLTTASGLTGMRDRIEAVGGELTITTSPGTGTAIRGRVDAAAL
jgi:signal transduction histidine kinase